MRLLLDTHVVLALCGAGSAKLPKSMLEQLCDPSTASIVSVGSLWEIAIKAHLGKLRLGIALEELPELLRSMGLEVLPIHPRHVLTPPAPEPATRDPFDRLLIAQCAAEGLRLVTIDRALAHHPLAERF